MGVPLYVICPIYAVAFNILCLSLTFVSLITLRLMSCCVLPWVYPTCYSLCFLDLVDYFLSQIREVFNYYPFKYFLRFFLSLFSSSGTCIMQMLVFSMLSQRFLRMSSFLFIMFSILLCGIDLHHSGQMMQVIYPFFHFSYSAIDSFLCVLFILVCLLFISSMSLAKIS